MGSKYKAQLCWDCRFATNPAGSRCSWARELKPVKGWTAERVTLAPSNPFYRRKGLLVETWHVRACPLFEEG